MLCSECHKEINQGKEIQIEGTIFCENCVNNSELKIKKEAISRCHTCFETIYKGNLIYESSFDSFLRENNFSRLIKYFYKFNVNEKVIQCYQCHYRWRFRQEKREKWLEKRNWLLTFSFAFLVMSIFIFFYPQFIKRILDELVECGCIKKLSHPYLVIATCSTAVSFVSFLIIIAIMKRAPEEYRYEYIIKKEKKRGRK